MGAAAVQPTELPFARECTDAIRDWLTYLGAERGLSDATVEAYARDLNQFIRFLDARLKRPTTLPDVAHLDLGTLRAFLAARRKSGIGSRSLARCLSALRNFYLWLERERGISNSAIRRVLRPKVSRGLPKPLTVESARAVAISDTGSEEWVIARNTAVLLL
ncbi:MAG: site-specific integrase, partial [Pseudomonadota bacterium]